jgi:hypothetical protein
MLLSLKNVWTVGMVGSGLARFGTTKKISNLLAKETHPSARSSFDIIPHISLEKPQRIHRSCPGR